MGTGDNRPVDNAPQYGCKWCGRTGTQAGGFCSDYCKRMHKENVPLREHKK
jgi:hypothetical protein